MYIYTYDSLICREIPAVVVRKSIRRLVICRVRDSTRENVIDRALEMAERESISGCSVNRLIAV